MDTQKEAHSGQEKLSGALASIIFFIPLLMGAKTPYVIGYMKQGFLINLIEVTLSIVGMFLWFLGPILSLGSFCLFCLSLFLAFQAYSGKEYAFPNAIENADKIIAKLGFENLFAPGK